MQEQSGEEAETKQVVDGHGDAPVVPEPEPRDVDPRAEETCPAE